MAREFQRGHKAKISDLTAGTDLYVGVQISAPGLSFDISCFGLDASERLSDDRYFIFFNQPKSPEESIQLLGAQAGDTESFRVTLDRVPQQIQRLSFTATIDGAGQMSQVASGYIRIVAGGEEVARYAFSGAEFSTERAVMLGDFYLKDVWRFAAIGQGFDGGLEALLKNFGGEVAEEEPAPAPPQSAAAPSFAPPAQAAAPPAFGAPVAPAPAPAQPAAPAPAPAPAPAQHFAPPQGATPPPATPADPMHAAQTVVAPMNQPPGAAVPPPPQAPSPYGQPGAQQQPPFGQMPGQQQAPGQTAPPPPGYGQQPQAPMPPGYGQPQGVPMPAGYGQPQGGQFPGQGAPQGVPQGAPQSAAPQGAGVAAALQKYREAPTGQRWTQQNEKLIRVDLGVSEQPILARQGSMVLYQGKVEFSYKGAGFAGRVVGNATGQEMQLMRCSGRGQVFLAEEGTHLHPIELQGDAICVSAENVLAFDETLQHEVRRIEGHGIPGGALFVMQFQGTGTVIVKTHGVPVVLPVTPTTFADCHAVVAWSAAAQAIVSSQVRMRSNAYAGSTGESVNLQFRGAPGNFIVVQPYEV
ncbi:stress protein [Streptomyces alfalfae]|uniref:Stress protein n=1 Tax=Streptomyces alfalfae TaxID=1642299 RepID=A0ABM6GR31_9ACTN|nr:TerD family protein [Streptomyces alfalfae]APY86464.1 stress protein [Streptomyces alfalfae]AYA16847.1 stress protein [Streptomyces fradiae]RXX41493.1 stress protein [Streptomyces alfalfae]RZM92599.1 stress protein [Streptomyces alfalfae]